MLVFGLLRKVLTNKNWGRSLGFRPSVRHDHIMVAVRIGDTIEAGEAVCQHGAAGSEEVSRPISNGCAREVGDGRELA